MAKSKKQIEAQKAFKEMIAKKSKKTEKPKKEKKDKK